MTQIHLIVIGVVLSGAGLCFLNGTASCLSRGQSRTERWLLGALCVCLSLFLLRAVLVMSETLLVLPRIGIMQFAWSYAIAPLLFLWVRSQISGAFRVRARHLALLAPVVPLGALDLYTLSLPGSHQAYLGICLVARLGPPVPDVPYLWLAGLAGFFVYASAAVFLLATLKALWRLWPLGSMPRRVLLLWIFLSGGLVALPLLFLSDLLVEIWIGRVGLVILAGMIVAQHLARTRDPEFMGELRRTTRRKSYERSALQNVDIDAARARLEELMHDERLYLDEELSLDTLGAELHLSRHQLSQLLNERIGKNFNEYLNEFRVRDACRMLIEEPERSVLSIAHAVGFNSKSSFHTAFRKFTGRTPLQFRAERRLLSA